MLASRAMSAVVEVDQVQTQIHRGRLARRCQNAARYGRFNLVSFDVFFQRFFEGEAAPGGGELMRAVLAPFIVREETQHDFALFEYGDGSADVYLDGDSMMANRVTGEEPWHLLVQGARAADWVIMPVGCPTCITAEGQRPHLPEELQENVAVVTNGSELVQVITST